MAKPYAGNVIIVLDTKGRIAVKADAAGRFSDANAAECWATMVALAKSHQTEAKVFRPEGGTVPRLLDGYGKPYMALLSPLPDGGTSRKTVTKLA